MRAAAGQHCPGGRSGSARRFLMLNFRPGTLGQRVRVPFGSVLPHLSLNIGPGRSSGRVACPAAGMVIGGRAHESGGGPGRRGVGLWL